MDGREKMNELAAKSAPLSLLPRKGVLSMECGKDPIWASKRSEVTGRQRSL